MLNLVSQVTFHSTAIKTEPRALINSCKDAVSHSKIIKRYFNHEIRTVYSHCARLPWYNLWKTTDLSPNMAWNSAFAGKSNSRSSEILSIDGGINVMGSVGNVNRAGGSVYPFS